MVQHSATDRPTEQSRLLADAGNAKGQPGGYVSIRQVSPEGSPSDEANGPVVKTRSDDEESVGLGEVEGIGGRKVAHIISVLLIGIFVGQADGTILLATHPAIASEFNDLGNSTWLITSFALASAATQALYGKLSDIYGRKSLVIFAYVVFVVGCTIVGMGQTMWQVILGRVISGAGASGMAGLVSILITDLFPIRDVAQWRAYVNLVATLGRSIGGPLGGWLVDAIGWRWSFFGQVPPIMLAILLVALYLPSSTTNPDLTDAIDNSASQKSKLSRVDFKGSILFSLMVLALLLPIELGGAKLPWSHPLILALFLLSPLLLFVFIAVEKRQVEPILPLEIFHRRDAVLSFAILGLQCAAQLGLMFTVPLYFRITARTSNAASGAHLVPAVVGNALGGVVSGILIKRSGRYKRLIILAAALSSFSYVLLMLRWHGNTNVWESLYIFPSGLGTGVAQSAVFVSLQAAITNPAHLAPAISFMYLSTSVGVTLGLPLSGAVLQGVLRGSLRARLVALGVGGDEIGRILENTASDVDFVDRVTGRVREAIVGSYVDGLWWSHGLSFLFSVTALVLALFIRQRSLDGTRA